MSVARHPRSKELEGVSLDEIMKRYVGRFKDKKPDWAAFEDAKIEGFKRAQHRFIGAGGSGKHGDPTVIPAGNFTLSIMYVEPGQGNAAHTHEVEECFFVLDGYLDVFVEDDSGKRLTVKPFDPTRGMLATDPGRYILPLAGRPAKPWTVSFPLVLLEDALVPGIWNCNCENEISPSLRLNAPVKSEGTMSAILS